MGDFLNPGQFEVFRAFPKFRAANSPGPNLCGSFLGEAGHRPTGIFVGGNGGNPTGRVEKLGGRPRPGGFWRKSFFPLPDFNFLGAGPRKRASFFRRLGKANGGKAAPRFGVPERHIFFSPKGGIIRRRGGPPPGGLGRETEGSLPHFPEALKHPAGGKIFTPGGRERSFLGAAKRGFSPEKYPPGGGRRRRGGFAPSIVAGGETPDPHICVVVGAPPEHKTRV